MNRLYYMHRKIANNTSIILKISFPIRNIPWNMIPQTTFRKFPEIDLRQLGFT